MLKIKKAELIVGDTKKQRMFIPYFLSVDVFDMWSSSMDPIYVSAEDELKGEEAFVTHAFLMSLDLHCNCKNSLPLSFDENIRIL